MTSSDAGIVRTQFPLALIAGTAILILIGGEGWLANLLKPLWLGLMLAWLFAAILWAAIGVVHHAGCPAAKLGESYGTLILKLAVSIATFSSNHTNGAPRFPFLLAGFSSGTLTSRASG